MQVIRSICNSSNANSEEVNHGSAISLLQQARTRRLQPAHQLERDGRNACHPGCHHGCRHAAAAAPTMPAANAPVSKEGESKLTVGPNIKLKGVEITDCDTLVVEGSVEATMDSRVIQISERGSFKGSAEIDIAEIRGEFDGNLTVRQKLVIYPPAR